VSQFFVCKKFFPAAAKAFIGNQVVADPLNYCKGPSLCHLNIMLRFIRTAEVNLGLMSSLFGSYRLWPSLKKLTINVTDYHWDVLDPKYPWEEELSQRCFETITKAYRLENLASIGEYHFTFDPSSYVEKISQLDVWQLKMRKFEEYVRAYVTAAKGVVSHPNSTTR
jgi:hypothetical protein